MEDGCSKWEWCLELEKLCDITRMRTTKENLWGCSYSSRPFLTEASRDFKFWLPRSSHGHLTYPEIREQLMLCNIAIIDTLGVLGCTPLPNWEGDMNMSFLALLFSLIWPALVLVLLLLGPPQNLRPWNTMLRRLKRKSTANRAIGGFIGVRSTSFQEF